MDVQTSGNEGEKSVVGCRRPFTPQCCENPFHAALLLAFPWALAGYLSRRQEQQELKTPPGSTGHGSKARTPSEHPNPH